MIFTDASKQAMLDGFKNRINKDSQAAVLNFYDSSNTLLASAIIDDGSLVTNNNTLVITPASQATATVTGTMASAKLYADDGTLLIDGLTVGLSSADIIADKLEIQQGGLVTVRAITIRF